MINDDDDDGDNDSDSDSDSANANANANDNENNNNRAHTWNKHKTFLHGNPRQKENIISDDKRHPKYLVKIEQKFKTVRNLESFHNSLAFLHL